MSQKTFNSLIKELNFPNIEPINVNYIRIFFQEEGLAQGFVNNFETIQKNMQKSIGVSIKAYLVGKKKSLVMIEGLGTLLERSHESFETVKALIRQYCESAIEGSAQQVLKISRKKSISTPSNPAPKRTAKKQPTVSEDLETSLLWEGDVERYFVEYILEEEAEVCKTLIDHTVQKFNLSQEESQNALDIWAKKNQEKNLIDYSPNYGKGEGLICLKS